MSDPAHYISLSVLFITADHFPRWPEILISGPSTAGRHFFFCLMFVNCLCECCAFREREEKRREGQSFPNGSNEPELGKKKTEEGKQMKKQGGEISDLIVLSSGSRGSQILRESRLQWKTKHFPEILTEVETTHLSLSSALSLFSLCCQRLCRRSLCPLLFPLSLSFSLCSVCLTRSHLPSPPVSLPRSPSYKYASFQLNHCLSVPGKPLKKKKKKKRQNKAEEGCGISVVTSWRLRSPWQLHRVEKESIMGVWEGLM